MYYKSLLAKGIKKRINYILCNMKLLIESNYILHPHKKTYDNLHYTVVISTAMCSTLGWQFVV